MNTDSKFRYQGSCLCGAVKYEVNRLEPKMGHCHCTMCRKFHGAAFATFGEARRENFRWLQGEDILTEYLAENGTTRSFCSRCGSSMIFRASDDQGDLVEFSLGTLDSDIENRPDAHIYMAYKANWMDVDDDLPKFPEGRDSQPE